MLYYFASSSLESGGKSLTHILKPNPMKPLFLTFMAFLFLGCLGCASTRRFNADDVASISLRVDETFTIDIRGNKTTGFIWRQVPNDESTALLELVGESYETVKSKRNLCGAPGTFHFQYRAKAPGKCLLQYECIRPWEKEAPPASTREITIIVE